MVEAVIYLFIITAAQIVSALYDPIWGIFCQTVVLVTLIVRSLLISSSNPNKQVLLPLVLLPLLRITSLALPLTDIPKIILHYLSYVIVFVAAIGVVRILGYSWVQLGVNFRRPITQILMAFTGISFGLAEYFILEPGAIITGFTIKDILLPALILLISAGFMVEFIFRGVLQSISTEAFSEWGIVYTSFLSTITYIGFLPTIELPFIFVVNLLFGYVVRKTGSIIGVSLSRGIWNIVLYLVAPFLLD